MRDPSRRPAARDLDDRLRHALEQMLERGDRISARGALKHLQDVRSPSSLTRDPFVAPWWWSAGSARWKGGPPPAVTGRALPGNVRHSPPTISMGHGVGSRQGQAAYAATASAAPATASKIGR